MKRVKKAANELIIAVQNMELNEYFSYLDDKELPDNFWKMVDLAERALEERGE